MRYRDKLMALIIIIIFTGSFSSHVFAETNDTKHILVLNSYHEGYKWSDDIIDGIQSELYPGRVDYDMQIEYMDTQRTNDPEYILKLKDIYEIKFKDKKFDVIISSDDAAFNFLKQYGNDIFSGVPVVFCGVNYFEDSMITYQSNFTGIAEGIDVAATINTALKIHPGTEKIYYICDDSITGQSIMKEFNKTLPEFIGRVLFEKIDGENLNEIENKVKDLSDNSLLLYMVYTIDKENNTYPYTESITRISDQCEKPIYILWEFNLGYGAVGGKLTNGYYQGSTAAKIALRVLNGEKPSEITVVTENTTLFTFDYSVMERFDIAVEDLPQNSIITNAERPDKKQVLILNSYNKGLTWTDDIETGIKSALCSELDDIEFTYEYMDVQKNPDPVSIQKIHDFLREKYKNRKFDAIITTDDEAFRFIRNNMNEICPGVPVVFCGVNYFDDSMIQGKDNISGVVETLDLASTIDIAMELQPNTEKIIVINDLTLTGAANRKALDDLIPLYEDRVSFEFWDNYNMSEIQVKASALKKNDIILLLSFNRDKSNNSFTYDESISMISQYTAVPIYSAWDFFLGKGIIGGMLTSGTEQGETVGKMVSDILAGADPSDMPIIRKSPNIFMFDYNIVKKFNIPQKAIPEDSKMINMPYTISEFYSNNKEIILVTIFIVSGLLIVAFSIFLILLNKNKNTLREKNIERNFARTDFLTGIYSRRACFELLEEQIRMADDNKLPLSIAYIDVNNLKAINDNLGHKTGDEIIKNVAEIISKNIRSGDSVCRIGGDEFIVILPDSDLHQAGTVWDRVLKTIESFNNKNSNYEISLSVGFAQYRINSCDTLSKLIEKADSEMFKNKKEYRKALVVEN